MIQLKSGPSGVVQWLTKVFVDKHPDNWTRADYLTFYGIVICSIGVAGLFAVSIVFPFGHFKFVVLFAALIMVGLFMLVRSTYTRK